MRVLTRYTKSKHPLAEPSKLRSFGFFEMSPSFRGFSRGVVYRGNGHIFPEELLNRITTIRFNDIMGNHIINKLNTIRFSEMVNVALKERKFDDVYILHFFNPTADGHKLIKRRMENKVMEGIIKGNVLKLPQIQLNVKGQEERSITEGEPTIIQTSFNFGHDWQKEHAVHGHRHETLSITKKELLNASLAWSRFQEPSVEKKISYIDTTLTQNEFMRNYFKRLLLRKLHKFLIKHYMAKKAA